MLSRSALTIPLPARRMAAALALHDAPADWPENFREDQISRMAAGEWDGGLGDYACGVTPRMVRILRAAGFNNLLMSWE